MPAAGDYVLNDGETFTMTYEAAEGYEFVDETEDGVRTATEDDTIDPPEVQITDPAATINGVRYATIPDAVAAAVDGDVIVVQRNVDCGYQVTMMKVNDGRKLTLDLNGFEVKASHDSYALSVSGEGSQITLQDSSVAGTGVLLKRGGDGTFTTIESSGKLIINSGKIEYPFTSTMNIIRAQNGGIVEINGGEIIADKSDAEIAAAGTKVYTLRSNSGSVITVNGGKIKGVVDDVSGAGTITITEDATALFDRDQTKFCSAGQITDECGDGWWFVGDPIAITYEYGDGTAPETANKATFAAYTAARTFTLNQPTAPSGKKFKEWTTDATGVTFVGDVMTIAADFGTAFTVTATYEADGPVWPDLPGEFPADADAAVKANYAAWATTYGVTDATGLSDAFLLNVDPKTSPLPELKITSIEVVDDVATIKVVAGEKNLAEGLNGVLFVSATDDLAGEWVTTEVEDAKSFENEGKTAIFEVDAGKFMKAKVGFKKEQVVEKN